MTEVNDTAKCITPFDDLPVAPDDLLDEAIALMNLTGAPDEERVRFLLKEHGLAFARCRWFRDSTPSVHEDAKRMRAIADAINVVLKGLDQLSPAISLPMAMAFSDREGAFSSLKQLQNDLVELEDVTRKFGGSKFARKQKDEVLINAVGGLMLLIETRTGNRARVSARRSYYAEPPKLSSPEAKVIGMLLRVADPDLLDTTLVNVISSIQRDFGDKYKFKFSHQLFLGAPIVPH